MKYRAAIASSDGIVVNQHFGRAKGFHILEIESDNGSYDFIESRQNAPCCNGGEHECNAFERVYQSSLSDVQAIIVSKIGNGAADYLESKGLVVYEAPYPIVPLVEKIIKERLYEVDQWQFPTTN